MIREFKIYFGCILLLTSFIVSCDNSDKEQNETSVDNEILNIDSCHCNDVVLDTDLNRFIHFDTEKPYTGICTEYIGEQLLKRKEFSEGMMNGKYLEYYKNGLLKNDWNFYNGRQDGWSRGYNEDGTLLFETEFDKDDIIVTPGCGCGV